MIIVLPITLTFVALELAARFYYYHQKGPHTLAISHLESRIKGLLTGMPGAELTQQAWAASFTELGKVPPESGPRDGFDGVRTNPKNVHCGYLIICETDQLIPGLADIQDNGLQYAGSENTQGSKILIIGGSVAWGAYASAIDTTYFSVLHKRLAESGKDTFITVLARGAARSDDDLAAFMLRGLALEPDTVIFLNALNDIYIPGPDGLEMDYREYLRNMEIARRVAQDAGIEFVVALQPFPHGKANKSRYEKAMLSRVEVAGFPDAESVEKARDAMRAGLQNITSNDHAHFLDCSTVFDAEQVTIFSDQWHFADRGQQLLADCLARELDALPNLSSHQSTSTNG